MKADPLKRTSNLQKDPRQWNQSSARPKRHGFWRNLYLLRSLPVALVSASLDKNSFDCL